MKKIIAYIVICTSLVTIAIVGFLFYLKFKPAKIYDTSRLQNVDINGQEIKTTGAIPNRDPRLKVEQEIIKLASMGPVIQDGFEINVDNHGNPIIKVTPPYDQNKTSALNWLKENGYGDIPSGQITISNN